MSKKLSEAREISSIFEITKSRIMNLRNVFQNDLGGSYIPFNCDFTSDHDKHLVVHELEKHISKDDYNFNKQGLHNTSLFVDFMANLRKVNVLGCRTFEDIFK